MKYKFIIIFNVYSSIIVDWTLMFSLMLLTSRNSSFSCKGFSSREATGCFAIRDTESATLNYRVKITK